jgi:hypothetical protein
MATPDPDSNGASVHVNQLSFIRFDGKQKLKRRTINMYCSFIERINSELAKIGLPDGLYRPQSGRFYWKRYGQPTTIAHILTIIRQIYTIESEKDMQMRMSPLISMLNMVSESALQPWLTVKEQLHAGPVLAPVGSSRLYPESDDAIDETTSPVPVPSYMLYTIKYTDQWQVEKTQGLTDEEHLQFLYELDPSTWIKFKYPIHSDDECAETIDKFVEQYHNAYYFIRHKDTLLSYIVEKLTP